MFRFIIQSVLLGVGLAMDAFSVSMANGLNDIKMKTSKMSSVAGVFGSFQTLMPLIGWICVHTIVELFTSFEKIVPYIALILLTYIGGKMLIDGVKNEEVEEVSRLDFKTLMIQGIATSIDALSVGFTIANYTMIEALLASLIIGVVTFFICIEGLKIGKLAGTKLSSKANILGGVILIAIGIEIFIGGIF